MSLEKSIQSTICWWFKTINKRTFITLFWLLNRGRDEDKLQNFPRKHVKHIATPNHQQIENIENKENRREAQNGRSDGKRNTNEFFLAVVMI